MLIGCVAGRLCFCYGVGWLHTDRSFRSYIRVPYAASKWPSLVTPDFTDSKKTSVKYINLLLASVPTMLHLFHNCILYFSNWLTAITFVPQEISNSDIPRLQSFTHKPISAALMSVRLTHVIPLFNHSNVIWWKKTHVIRNLNAARGGAVGWGTALQTGRSRVRFPMVSLEFFIDIILLAALWPRGWLSL